MLVSNSFYNYPLFTFFIYDNYPCRLNKIRYFWGMNKSFGFFLKTLGKLLALLVLMSVQKSFAQSPSLPETLTFINEKLSLNCKIDVRKSVVVSKCFNIDQVLFREDRVVWSELAITSIGYEASDSLLFIPCMDDAGKCVEREMFITGNSRPYARISFQLANGEADYIPVRKAFLHLEQLIDNPKYNKSVIFDK